MGSDIVTVIKLALMAWVAVALGPQIIRFVGGLANNVTNAMPAEAYYDPYYDDGPEYYSYTTNVY